MGMIRVMAAMIGVGLAPLLISACGSGPEEPGSGSHHGVQHGQDAPQEQDSQSWHTPAAPGDGYWDEHGQPIDGGPVGADGSTGNSVTKEYCAQSEDPACPAGSYVGPNAIQDPQGGNDYVPCEGSICTNPNHGAGDDPDSQNPPGCEGSICTNPNHGAGDDPDSQDSPDDWGSDAG